MQSKPEIWNTWQRVVCAKAAARVRIDLMSPDDVEGLIAISRHDCIEMTSADSTVSGQYTDDPSFMIVCARPDNGHLHMVALNTRDKRSRVVGDVFAAHPRHHNVPLFEGGFMNENIHTLVIPGAIPHFKYDRFIELPGIAVTCNRDAIQHTLLMERRLPFRLFHGCLPMAPFRFGMQVKSGVYDVAAIQDWSWLFEGDLPSPNRTVRASVPAYGL